MHYVIFFLPFHKLVLINVSMFEKIMEKGLTPEIFPQKRKLDKSVLMDDHDQMLTSCFPGNSDISLHPVLFTNYGENKRNLNE